MSIESIDQSDMSISTNEPIRTESLNKLTNHRRVSVQINQSEQSIHSLILQPHPGDGGELGSGSAGLPGGEPASPGHHDQHRAQPQRV